MPMKFSPGFFRVVAYLVDLSGVPIDPHLGQDMVSFTVHAPAANHHPHVSDTSLDTLETLPENIALSSRHFLPPVNNVPIDGLESLERTTFVVMTARSYGRYQEAVTLIKSMLFNR
jgi:hypothetical protein